MTALTDATRINVRYPVRPPRIALDVGGADGPPPLLIAAHCSTDPIIWISDRNRTHRGITSVTVVCPLVPKCMSRLTHNKLSEVTSKKPRSSQIY